MTKEFDFDSAFDDPIFAEMGAETEKRYQTIDICGLVEKMKAKDRRLATLRCEEDQLAAMLGDPPKESEAFKMLSVGGGFSSLAIIKWVADEEAIEDLSVSTFRIGKRHFDALCKMREDGLLVRCRFITSQTQERTDDKKAYKGKTYNYYDYIVEKCKEYGWEIKSFDNHSKVILMKTKKGNFYVVETSSNLNENPKMEQFNWENDEMLYRWYSSLFDELVK